MTAIGRYRLPAFAFPLGGLFNDRGFGSFGSDFIWMGPPGMLFSMTWVRKAASGGAGRDEGQREEGGERQSGLHGAL